MQIVALHGFIIYLTSLPGALVLALFAAGMISGGGVVDVALIVPAVWLSREHKMGALESSMLRPAFWASLKDAVWGLAWPVLILSGMRAGWFTPTEATVAAVFYSLFIRMVIHCTVRVRDFFEILRESCELLAVTLLIMLLAGIFVYFLNTFGRH